jgi:phospholipid/cholesterol/gamma-HCH transport system permease protein
MSKRPTTDPLPPAELPEIISHDDPDGSFVLEIRGRLDVETSASIWARGRKVKVDFQGLAPAIQRLLDAVDIDALESSPTDIHPPDSAVVEIGRAFDGLLHDIVTLVAFVGELTAALVGAVLNPRRIRWRDALLTAEQVGVNALPIIALIGFLLGLILSFQAAVPMKQFGAEIFVADLVGLSLVRELAPLMTAIILAGRSGSAFAAELGTMKVNEELDALATMGLEPVRFLVVTRVIAAVAMTPLLTVFSILFGLLGGLIVFLSLGFPVVTYFNELVFAVSYGDLLGGLFKALVFGLLVAGIGCLRGLQTRTGASAVGLSATSAVVSGILLIALSDGLFAVIFYLLDI